MRRVARKVGRSAGRLGRQAWRRLEEAHGEPDVEQRADEELGEDSGEEMGRKHWWLLVMVVVSVLVLVAFEFGTYFALKGRALGRGHKWLVQVLKTTLVMCVAWGFLFWAEVVFHGADHIEKPIISAVVFMLVTCTTVFVTEALLIYVVVSYSTGDTINAHMRRVLFLCVRAIALVAAWSVEQLADTIIEVGCEEDKLLGKYVLTAVGIFCILPLYAYFIRPRVEELEEEQEEGEKQVAAQESAKEAGEGGKGPAGKE